MPVESELKFRAGGPDPLRTLEDADTLADAELGPPATHDELDRYLDTAEGHLGAARWACRLRTRSGSTRVSLKGPPQAGTAGSLHRRPEVDGPATDDPDPSAWPRSPARDLVDRLRQGQPLGERFRLLQRRTERSVVQSGRALGTLSLDQVEVHGPAGRLGRLYAVELELGEAVAADADEARLAALAEALKRHEGLEADSRSKLEYALDLLRA